MNGPTPQSFPLASVSRHHTHVHCAPKPNMILFGYQRLTGPHVFPPSSENSSRLRSKPRGMEPPGSPSCLICRLPQSSLYAHPLLLITGDPFPPFNLTDQSSSFPVLYTATSCIHNYGEEPPPPFCSLVSDVSDLPSFPTKTIRVTSP